MENRHLSIYGLPLPFAETDLREHFEKYGKVEKLEVFRDHFGNLRSLSFVDFEKVEDASRAVSELNGRPFKGRPIMVTYRKEHSRFSGKKLKVERTLNPSTVLRAKRTGATQKFMPPIVRRGPKIKLSTAERERLDQPLNDDLFSGEILTLEAVEYLKLRLLKARNGGLYPRKSAETVNHESLQVTDRYEAELESSNNNQQPIPGEDSVTGVVEGTLEGTEEEATAAINSADVKVQMVARNSLEDTKEDAATARNLVDSEALDTARALDKDINVEAFLKEVTTKVAEAGYSSTEAPSGDAERERSHLD